MSLKSGKLRLNNLDISINDTLTVFLNKTMDLPKQIENINNFYHIYLKNIYMCGFSLFIKIIFNEVGKFWAMNISIENTSNNADEYFKLFQILSNEKPNKIDKFGIIVQNEYSWGSAGIYKERFFGDMYISLTRK